MLQALKCIFAWKLCLGDEQNSYYFINLMLYSTVILNIN